MPVSRNSRRESNPMNMGDSKEIFKGRSEARKGAQSLSTSEGGFDPCRTFSRASRHRRNPDAVARMRAAEATTARTAVLRRQSGVRSDALLIVEKFDVSEAGNE